MIGLLLFVSLPSSGSSLAHVSAVIRLAMKRWLFLGLLLCWLGPLELTLELMEEPSKGLFITEQEDEEDVGSLVVARCSFSVSMSKLSNLTWAVLRGCLSFCTANWEECVELEREWQIRRISKRNTLGGTYGNQTHHLCSCQLEGISLGDMPGTGYDGLYLLDTYLYQLGTCKFIIIVWHISNIKLSMFFRVVCYSPHL